MNLKISIDDEVYSHFLNNAYSRADIMAVHTALNNAESDIIRCKDCKYLQKLRFPEQVIKKYGQIYECSLDVMPDPTPDDYCSKAERKEGKN